MNISANPNKLLGFFAAFAVFSLTACGSAAPDRAADPGPPPLEGATIGGEFELSNSAGETVRWGDFSGKYRVVYFGYAYCPDICPTDMQRITQGLNQFADDAPQLAAQIQPIFITIDPDRDTGEVLAEFTNAFSEDLIGLRGTAEQTAEVTSTFKVLYSRGEEAPGGGYLMNHSTIAYLFGPDGEPIATLPKDQGADAVTEELAIWVR